MPHLLLEYDSRGCPEKYCQPQEQTIEGRRVVVACFLTTSMYGPGYSYVDLGILLSLLLRVSGYFSKIDPLRWTPYLEQCLNVMAESQVPGDTLLAQLVQLQLVDNKAAQISGLEWHCGTPYSAKTPWPFYLKALQAQLKEIRNSIPSDLQDNGKSGYYFL